jgi:hypothetical protein
LWPQIEADHNRQDPIAENGRTHEAPAHRANPVLTTQESQVRPDPFSRRKDWIQGILASMVRALCAVCFSREIQG